MESSQTAFAAASVKSGDTTKRKHRRGMSLARRRLIARTRRLTSALLAGLAMFSVLQCVMATVRTQPMLVTTAHVSRGERLHATQLATISVPAHASFAQAPATPAQVESSIALVDMPAGTLILASHIRGRPIPPEGSTVIEAPLASQPDSMVAGDTVDLIVGQSCDAIGYSASSSTAENAGTDDGQQAQQPQAQAPSQTPEEYPPADASAGTDSQPGQPCVIAQEATVIAVPSDTSDGVAPGTDSKTAIAMRPEEALALMRLPDGLPVIAARRAAQSASDQGAQ
ncbi:SAF domain-containing protein [Bifidobacterium thermophilum]|uniref:SAF domain-containing protein n=1 Tax=Bifidobacterium thermophilum RBL67 TaxID=1254439 RepID=M4RE17_9BIFI|nr:SAF domain-containing protein [Bifidobacterium thermophilum]AGH41745.1 SAF domain-containing protein [Bifidobacterium thermophilum RBL67]MDW8486312.1 SAF domain-containing protein [Bifidobacterium thermophilum]